MKTGLVLEGGALRTIYSSGVTDGLLEGNIDFDYVVGVSAGIAYGVSFLSRQFGRNLEILMRYATDKRYMGARNLLKPGNRSYFGLDFAYHVIPNELVPYDYATLAAWPGLAEAVVTDVETGRPAYFPVTGRTTTSCCSRRPVRCLCCSPFTITMECGVWTVVRRTVFPGSGRWSRGATGWW